VPEEIPGSEDWMVPAMILAVYQHRRRISQLLQRLDDPQRAAVEAAVTALSEGTVDAATLLAKLGEGVREGEGRMHQLTELLELEPLREARRLNP
jgi:hypothetical protein